MVPELNGHPLIRFPIVFYVSLAVAIAAFLVMSFTTDMFIPHIIEGAIQWLGGMTALFAIPGTQGLAAPGAQRLPGEQRNPTPGTSQSS